MICRVLNLVSICHAGAITGVHFATAGRGRSMRDGPKRPGLRWREAGAGRARRWHGTCGTVVMATMSRLVTYVIEAALGSGTVMLNGPAARLGEPGDPVIILAYGHFADAAARRYRARIVRTDSGNKPLIDNAKRPLRRTERKGPT